jgi:hypothetical protein
LRVQNRALFARIFAALVSGGCIAMRDAVMDAREPTLAPARCLS